MTKKTSFKERMNRHGVARSTILLGIEQQIQVEYMVVDDAKTLWEKLVSACKLKLSSTCSRSGTTFGASSDMVVQMSTTTHCGFIGMSRITISAQDYQPLTLMLPIQSLQRQSPRQVSMTASSTSFAESQGTTSGSPSWSL